LNNWISICRKKWIETQNLTCFTKINKKMDCRLKYRRQNYETLKREHKEIIQMALGLTMTF
jgi:hypothetical protein